MKQILRISKVCFFFFDGIVFALAFISFSSGIISSFFMCWNFTGCICSILFWGGKVLLWECFWDCISEVIKMVLWSVICPIQAIFSFLRKNCSIRDMHYLISTSDGFYGIIKNIFFRVISGIIFFIKISSIFYRFPIIQGIIFCVIRSRSFRSMISGSMSFKWFCSSGFKGSCSIRFKSFVSKNFKSFCSMISFSMIFKSLCSICFKNFFNMIFRMFWRIFCKIFSIQIFIMALILDPIFFPALATSSKQKIVSPVRRTNFSPRAATHKPVENRVPLGCGAVAAEKAVRYTITTTTTVR